MLYFCFLEYNPRLSDIPKKARVAYAKFMTKKMKDDLKTEDERLEELPGENQTDGTEEEETKGRKPSVTFQSKLVLNYHMTTFHSFNERPVSTRLR